MLSAIIYAALLSGAALAESDAPSTASIPLVVKHCDFGEQYQFQIATCRFELRNEGPRPLRISKVRSTSADDTVSQSDFVIEGNSVEAINFSMPTLDRLGQLVRFVTFDVEGESRKLIASGFVLSDLDDAAQRLDFGAVNALEGSRYESVSLSSHAVADLRIDKIVDKPAWVDADVQPDHRSVRVRVKKDAPWIPSEGKIKLRVNTPNQSEAWITVGAVLQGEVIPSINPYEIGPVHQGGTIEFAVNLAARRSGELKLGKIAVQGPQATIERRECIPAAAECVQLRATLPKDMPLGLFRGSLVVELPDYERSLPIGFGGLIVAKTSEIRKGPPPGQAGGAEGGDANSGSASVAAPQVDVSGALRSSILQARFQAATPVPAGKGPLLRWQVANEAQVYGYLIQRSDRETGPWVRVNKEVIRAKSEGSGWTYQWRDVTAALGNTYWYQVSLIDKNGKVKSLSGPRKIVAK